MHETLYQILGVQEDATPEQLRAAYRRQAMKWHPDRNPDNRQEAEARFKEISLAYKTLFDPVSRAAYDEELAEQRRHAGAGAGFAQSEAGISEEEAAKLFFEMVSETAIDLARRGHDEQFIYSTLMQVGCPEPIARMAAVMAVKHAGSGTSTPTPGPGVQGAAQGANNPPVRPWIRYFARYFDLTLFALLGYVVIGHFKPDWLAMPGMAYALLVPFSLAWAFVEAGLLSEFGTTPGKWLLNTKLSLASGDAIDYERGLSRSLKVWWRGLGTGFPLVSLFTMLMAYSRLEKHGFTSWDEEGEFVVSHARVGNIQGAAVILIFVAVLVVPVLIERGLNTVDDAHPHVDTAQSAEKPQQTWRPITNEDLGTDSKSTDYWINLGGSYVKAGQYTQAIEAFKQALRIDPQNANAWYSLGVSYDSIGQPTQAIEAYQRAVRIDPQNAYAWSNLGGSYVKAGQPTQAIEASKQALRIDPQNAYAWNNLGVSYVKAGQPTQAIEAYQRAVRIDPQNAYAWSNLGISYDSIGQPTQAIEAYQRAVRIDPQNAKAWYNLGVNYASIGRTDELPPIYHRLRSLSPQMAESFFQGVVLPTQ